MEVINLTAVPMELITKIAVSAGEKVLTVAETELMIQTVVVRRKNSLK